MPASLAAGLRELIDRDEKAEEAQTGKASASLRGRNCAARRQAKYFT